MPLDDVPVNDEVAPVEEYKNTLPIGLPLLLSHSSSLPSLPALLIQIKFKVG